LFINFGFRLEYLAFYRTYLSKFMIVRHIFIADHMDFGHSGY